MSYRRAKKNLAYYVRAGRAEEACATARAWPEAMFAGLRAGVKHHSAGPLSELLRLAAEPPSGEPWVLAAWGAKPKPVVERKGDLLTPGKIRPEHFYALVRLFAQVPILDAADILTRPGVESDSAGWARAVETFRALHAFGESQLYPPFKDERTSTLNSKKRCASPLSVAAESGNFRAIDIFQDFGHKYSGSDVDRAAEGAANIEVARRLIALSPASGDSSLKNANRLAASALLNACRLGNRDFALEMLRECRFVDALWPRIMSQAVDAGMDEVFALVLGRLEVSSDDVRPIYLKQLFEEFVSKGRREPAEMLLNFPRKLFDGDEITLRAAGGLGPPAFFEKVFMQVKEPPKPDFEHVWKSAAQKGNAEMLEYLAESHPISACWFYHTLVATARDYEMDAFDALAERFASPAAKRCNGGGIFSRKGCGYHCRPQPEQRKRVALELAMKTAVARLDPARVRKYLSSPAVSAELEWDKLFGTLESEYLVQVRKTAEEREVLDPESGRPFRRPLSAREKRAARFENYAEVFVSLAGAWVKAGGSTFVAAARDTGLLDEDSDAAEFFQSLPPWARTSLAALEGRGPTGDAPDVAAGALSRAYYRPGGPGFARVLLGL